MLKNVARGLCFNTAPYDIDKKRTVVLLLVGTGIRVGSVWGVEYREDTNHAMDQSSAHLTWSTRLYTRRQAL